MSDSDEKNKQPLIFPPEVEKYISPSLWRKLKSGTPRRGVLVNGLERLRSIQYLLATYIPNHIVQEKMRRPVPGLVGGEYVNGSLLFADVSGFTALSERLADLGPEGAEHLTEIMNRYFTAMLEILSWSGGILVKFAGDATLVYFPEQEGGAQANWAARAGLRMLRAMKDFSKIETPKGNVRLRMKIGLATGNFLSASVGSAQRMEYGVIGPAVSDTMKAEGASAIGQLVVNKETITTLSSELTATEKKSGYYVVTQDADGVLDDFEIKAERRRARGAIPWDASPQAIVDQMKETVQQIQALSPYLATELADRIIAHARERRVESEYRPTTVLFCNFTGPEGLLMVWGKDGADRVTSLLSAYFNAMNEVITRYGGIVSRIDPYSKGTKMLVLFGAPVTHEDDPQRAVSTALAMNAELAALNERWKQRFARHLPPNTKGPLIQQRIGITQGITFAGQVGSSNRREYTVMGDDVNLAARLMGAAKNGQILLSQLVYDDVSNYFVLDPLPAIKVKGKTKPIPLYQVDGPRDDTLVNRVDSRGPLIGRDKELGRAEKLMEKGLGGDCTMLMVRGAAGIGKSHFADELVKRALYRKARALSFQCRSYTQDNPYAGWSAILRSLAGITSLDHAQVHHEKLKELLAELKISEDEEAPLATLMGLKRTSTSEPAVKIEDETEEEEDDGELTKLVKSTGSFRRGSSLDFMQRLDDQQSSESGEIWQTLSTELTGQERDRVFGAVEKLFNQLLTESPVIVYFEDAQWMNAASRDLLEYLMERCKDVPLFVLLVKRGEGKGDSKVGQTLTLGSMDLPGTRDLVSHYLVHDLAEFIHEQSQGNPLFIREITQWLRRTRQISPGDLKKVLRSSDILQELVLSSLETLPESQKEIAKVASVIGNEFRIGEIQALMPDSMDPVTLSGHLRKLDDMGLIALTEAGANSRYAYHQTLVRDILYNSLPFHRRRDLHTAFAQYLGKPVDRRRKAQAKIAAFLGSSPGDDETQQAEIIAGHYERAKEWLSAAQNLIRAGDLAREQGALSKASDNYQNAAADLEKIPAQDLNKKAQALKSLAYMSAGDMALQTQEYTASMTAYEAAQASLPEKASAEEKTSDEEKAVIGNKLALALTFLGKAAQAIAILQDLPTEEKTDRNLAVTATLAWLHWREGKDDAEAWIAKGMEAIPESLNPWRAGIETILSEFSGQWETASETYLILDKPVGAALAAIRLGDRSLEAGDEKAARKHYERTAELWENEAQETCGMALSSYRMAELHRRDGDKKAALAALDDTLERLEDCAPSIRADNRATILKAIKIVKGKKSAALPTWKWQQYDDAFRISLLFLL